MTSTARQTTRPLPRGIRLLLWAIAALCLPGNALAQSSACDQLKTTLAARIEATGVRGYSLEAVPAATPVPAGAKAIGNCEGGVRKILYRRWGGASALAPAETVVAAAREAPVSASKPMPVPTIKAEAAKPPPARASEIELARAAESAAPQAMQARPAEVGEAGPPLTQRVSGFVATHWRWLLALLLVPLAAVGWAWRAHHLAYDRNGLPRGPRL